MNDARKAPAPTKKPRGRFHHGDLREALVRAAIESVEREGHEALTLRELAKKLRVTQPAMYRHFASKEALLAEVGTRGFLAFDAALSRAIVTRSDPYDRLLEAGRVYVRHAHAHRGWFRLFFSRTRTESSLAISAAAPVGSESRNLLRAAIGEIVDKSQADVDDVFRCLWGQCHGLAWIVVERVFQLVDTDAERIAAADRAIEVFVDALRARFGARKSSRGK